MLFRFPILALLAILAIVLGTERLGRPLTDDEKKRLGALLRAHDYPAVRLVALRFAHRLTRSRARAEDLMARVDERLVRLGWDPDQVSLARYLCRVTWSEWTNTAVEDAKIKKAEKAYLRDLEVSEGLSVPSIEQRAAEREAEEQAAALAKVQLDKLRAWFEGAGDTVNVLWLDAALAQGTAQLNLKQLAAECGRDVAEFYAAAKRRTRAVQRLLAKDRGVELSIEA
jgi:hypothetical protein